MAADAETSQVGRAPGGISFAVAFTAAVAALVVMTGGTLLLLSNASAARSTKELVRDKAELASIAIADRVERHLVTVLSHSAFTAARLGALDPASLTDEELGRRLFLSTAGAPQISSVALVDRSYSVLRTYRDRPAPNVERRDWSDDAAFRGMLRGAWSATEPFWGPLFYAEGEGSAFLNVFAPVRAGDRVSHLLISSVSLDDFSRFMLSLRREITGEFFILYGEDAVLAQSRPAPGSVTLGDRKPLPLLADLAPSPLSRIWSPERKRSLEADLANDFEVRVVDAGSDAFAYVFRRLDRFGDVPWIVGGYFPLSELAPQLTRNRLALIAGAGIVVVALAVALAFARLVSRPVRRLAVAAEHVNTWQIDRQPHLPPSVFREINDANRAFEAAHSALRSLQVYIPRRLAHEIVERGGSELAGAEEREVSIMFADIAGFTALAEKKPAGEVLDLLNAHFTLLEDCIEEQHGIVDKFIGDAVMAFWGGLGRDPEHARHACRAALAIADCLRFENGRLRQQGEEPLRLRIGVHSGRAMLGNIGSPGRMNYTLIGDAVNTAQRLESLAREFDCDDDGDEVICLLSGETAARLGTGFTTVPLGRTVLHGRHSETEVFRLDCGERGRPGA